MRLRSLWERWGWPVVAVLPSVVAMAGTWSTSHIFYYRDATLMFWPYKVWFRRGIAEGVFPMWDRSPAFGQSAVVDPMRQILFPPVILARLIPDDVLGHNLIMAAPAFLLALGVYVLLRRSVSREAAALGAVLMSLSSPVLSSLSMANMSWTLALGPWVIVALARLVESPSILRLTLASAAVGLLILAGEPVTGAGMMCTALFHALFVAGGERASVVRRFAWLGAACAFGLLLAAIQLVPVLSVLAVARRSDPTVLDYLTWSLHPLRLLETIVPLPFGNAVLLASQFGPWMSSLNVGREPFLLSLYLGVATLALAAIGAASGPRRQVVLWAVVAIVSLVVTMGTYTGLLPALVGAIPPLKILRIPEKHFLTTSLAVCALAAYGWDALRAGRLERPAVVAGVASVVGIVVVIAAAYAAAPQLARIIAVPEAPVAVAMLRSALARGVVPVLAVGGLLMLAVAATRSAHPRTTLVRAVLFSMLAFDLIMSSSQLNLQMPVAQLEEQAWMRTVNASGGRIYVGYRFFDLPEPDPDAYVATISTSGANYTQANAIFMSRLAESPSLFSLRDTFSFDPTNLWPRTYFAARDRFHFASPNERATFLARTGVRVQVLTRAPAGPYGPPEPIDQVEPIAAYHSTEPAERALLVPGYAIEPNPIRAFDALFRPEFDYRNVALVDREAPPAGAPGTPEPASVRVVDETANTISLETTCDSESTLVVLDSYNTGWSVEVDGAEAPLLRANGLFRGVRLAPGRHTVEMRYLPRELLVGGAISASTALMLLAGVWLERRRTRRAGRAIQASTKSNRG